ncbi:DUF4411 family protein [Aestuariimicrobium sp. Y1814]|uniref:DUF4411 family protein n=1 Tax=Aestuariimicrobium sp. Y1814 TaxID=3418742 RepID=UPI003DA77CD4
MANLGTLFDDLAKYSIDTNVILSFLREDEAERYPMDVFKPQWDFLQKAIADGRVVAARRVETELAKWQKTIPAMKGWLSDNKHMFCDIATDEQLVGAKRIVNAYPAYGSNENYLGDLEVMVLALSRQLTVVSLELKAQQHSVKRPKIPNVCEQFGIGCANLAGFLRAEGFTSDN